MLFRSGLISAVLRQYRPDFALNTALPKKVRPAIYIPSDDDIRRLLEYVKGTEMELPILLAAFGPMRRGEICALNTKNIDGNIVHVCCNMVCTEKRNTTISTMVRLVTKPLQASIPSTIFSKIFFMLPIDFCMQRNGPDVKAV